jgi:hypothetical protein
MRETHREATGSAFSGSEERTFSVFEGSYAVPVCPYGSRSLWEVNKLELWKGNSTGRGGL